jgi:hypothetical protein
VGEASKYWQFFKLGAAGAPQMKELIAVKAFFQAQFLTGAELPPQTTVQRRLMDLIQSEEGSLAEQSLRCYISHQIVQNCRLLGTQFGRLHGFTDHDLLPFVLDDDGKGTNRSYTSLALQVLKTFDPGKGSLNTWVARYVKQNSDLRRFLSQQGVCLLSDWAILNDTSLARLRRVLTEFSHWTFAEVEAACALVKNYHAVYREDRLQQGLRTVCLPPTPEQLERIAQLNPTVPAGRVLSQLQTIARQLRQNRVAVQGGLLPSVSIDDPVTSEKINKLPNETNDEQNEFLTVYRQDFQRCLDQALAEVTNDRIAKLQAQRKPKHDLFLKALFLFICRGETMTGIAAKVGLSRQCEVSRLLKLRDLRADVRHHLLLSLRDRLLVKAQEYATSERLQALDKQIDTILDAQITHLLDEAASESQKPIRSAPQSLFYRRLCTYLDTLIDPLEIHATHD